MWTLFWDMHSGGGIKEKPYDKIYIEAPEEEAKIIFYNRFGHNPERVTCTCCGEDYSIYESYNLKQASGFHRGCKSLKTPRLKNGLYDNDNPVLKKHLYLEKGEKPPKGFTIDDDFSFHKKYIPLKDYIKQKNVLVIYKKDIKPEERKGEIPQQGYVWID